MKTLNEMITERAKVWNAAKAFLDTHTVDGKVSAEDMNTYNRMEEDVVNIGKLIEARRKQDEIDNELNQPVSNPILATPKVENEKELTGRASEAYHKAFTNMLRGAQFSNVLSTTPGQDGGYLIPTELERQIVVDLYQENVFRKLAKVIVAEHDRKIPVSATHSVAAWTAENAAYTESNPTWSQKELDAYKLTDLVRISDELLQDSAFNMEEYIAGEFARAFAIKEEEAFCVGDGSGKPTGLFTASGADVGVTTASATAITADELISLVYSLKAPYRKNAKFLLNDATVAAIRKLKDGNGVYLWQPALVGGEPDKLLGYDIYTSAYVPTVAANAYTVAFGDFSYYWIADRQNRTMKRLNELYATNGQVGFVSTQRVDGKIILSEGIKLIKQHA